MSRKGSHVRTAAARTSSSAGQPSPLSRRRRAREASVQRSSRMHFDKFAFGSIEIDGSTYEHDVVIDRGEINKRQEKTLQEIPRGVRSYAAVRRGKDTLEMSAPRGRNRRAGFQ